ncbi:MAG: alginate lyase-domain-containing protein [Linnemannia gamsii]|nr:MAG: alginate lyase-domain-containing protein [Linnemannia gamsii]
MMKKARPNSVSSLPLHQFKDKPIPADSVSSATGALPGQLNLRKVILGAGGILFVYILLSTVFGPGPEHDGSTVPSVRRPESDPYMNIPIDHDTPHRYAKPSPVENRNPWDNKPSEQQQKQPAGGSGSESGVTGGQPTDDQEPTEDETSVTPPSTEESDEDEEEDSELTEEEETLLSLAIKARNNSPASYVDLLSANRRERDYAIALIVKEADLALKSDRIYSVTNKKQTAPSNDIHDYLSLSKYYWPNPKTSNGLPYIRKDGHINHEEINSVEDYKLLRTMIREVHMMGMAYHFTGNKEYVTKCIYRLNEWFFDEETYMKPNINYGSLQKGQPFGVRTGVLDMFTIFRVFDALHYLKQDSDWPQDMIPNLQAWFTEYVKWLETSPLAKLERKGNNNHGTYYDVQLIGVYLFLERTEDARAVAQSALTNRIDIQITGEGRQPDELARKTSWYYSVFNLQALMTLARWGDDLNVNMWDHVGPNGQSIKKAIDFLLPYALKDGADWPVVNIKGFPMGDYLKCLQIAWNIYGDEQYLKAIKYLQPKIQKQMDDGALKTISTYMCDISTLLEANVRGGQGFIWHWCLT